MDKSKTFTEKVKMVVKEIPQGETLSYKSVATRSGNPLASRAVARIMSANYNPDIPCHRVICANGSLGGYNRVRKCSALSQEVVDDFDQREKTSYNLNSRGTRGTEEKKRLLQKEGNLK